MNFSRTGYRDDSPDKNRSSNVILSNNITMEGVSIPITAVPIYNGKPDYSKKKTLRPGDKNAYFPGAEAVLEMPFAQSGIEGVGGNPYITSPFSGIQPYGIQAQEVPLNLEEDSLRQALLASGWQPPTTPAVPTTNTQAPTQYTWGDFITGLGTSRDTASAYETAGYYSNLRTNDIEWASPQAKRQARSAQTLGIIGGLGSGLLGNAKSFLSGAALANRESQAAMERDQNYRDFMENRNTAYARTYQDGGKVTDEKILTGAYTTGIPEKAPIEPNVEVEAGEYIQDPLGKVTKVLGKKHSEGGELMDLEDNTDIISDHLKVGRELAKVFSQNFDIKVSPKDTFAKVIDKNKKAIGLTKKLEEYEEVIGKIKKQEEVEDEATRELNLSFLSKRVQEIEAELAPLNQDLESFTKLVFEEQEKQKTAEAESKVYKKGGTKLFQEGGTISAEETEGILQAYAQATGVAYEEVVQGFSELSPQDREVALGQMVSELESVSPGGIEELVMVFAEIQGVDPELLMQELQALPEDQLQQAVIEMTEVVSQYNNSPDMSGEAQAVEQMQDGGTPRFRNRQEFEDYLENFTGVAEYGYDDLDSTRRRIKELFEVNNLDSSGFDFDSSMTREELNRAFGEMQQQMIDRQPDTAVHYMGNRSHTKQDLDFYIDRGLLTPSYLRSLGLKVGPDGKAVRGVREQGLDRAIDDEIYKEIKKAVQEKGEEDILEDYQKTGFRDNKSYYRGWLRPEVPFSSEEEFNSFVNDGGYQLISDRDGKPTYYSGKEGLYFTPIYPENTTVSPDLETSEQAEGAGLAPYTVDASGRRVALPWRSMDQSIWLNPSLDLPRKQQVTPMTLQGVNVSPQAQINEINKQVNLANAMTNFSPDVTRASQIANIFSMGTDAKNKAISEANFQNAQLNQQMEQNNDAQVLAAQRMNAELASDYDTKYLMARANLESQLLGRDQYMRNWDAMRERERWNRNLAATLYPQFTLGPSGEVVSTPNQTLGVGIFNPIEQKERVRTTNRVTNPDGSTTTRTVTAQKGGSIRAYLESRILK